MANKSTYLANLVITNNLRTGTVYLAAFSVPPGVAGTGGTEISGNAYARQSCAFNAPASGATANTADVVFPAASPAAWGQISALGVYDALTTGNLLYIVPEPTLTTVLAGANSTTQNVGSTAGMSIGDWLYFATAGVARLVTSITDGTHVVLSAAVTTTTGETVTATKNIGIGDQLKVAAGALTITES